MREQAPVAPSGNVQLIQFPGCALSFEPSAMAGRHTVEFWEGKAMKDLLEPLGIIVPVAVVVKLTALLFDTAVGASIAAALWH